jgi:ABC-type amino acid transport substrate-binding protein
MLTPIPQAKGFQLQRFDDEATELQALIAGQVDLGGTGLLVNQRLIRNNPGKDYQVKIVLRPLHFGVGIRRGEIDKLQWLNTFIYTLKNNGELDGLRQIHPDPLYQSARAARKRPPHRRRDRIDRRHQAHR